MASPAELAVVGAGIVGTALARELQSRGLRCLLVDSGVPGHGASFGNAGHIAVEQLTPLAHRGAWREVPALLLGRGVASLRWRDAATVLPWSVEFLRNCSSRHYAANHRTFLALQSNTVADWRELSVACPAVGALTQFLGHDEIFESKAARSGAQAALLAQRADGVNWRDLQPDELNVLRSLAPRAVDGVRYLDTGYVKTPLGIVEALYEDFRAKGGRFVHSDIRCIAPDRGGFILKTHGADVHARRVVIAGGSRSARLLAPLGLRVPLIAERGYHLSFSRHIAGLQRPLLLRERSAVLTPMSFGFRCTSFVEFAAPGSTPTASKWTKLAQHLKESGIYLPSDQPQTWMGERPTLPDYLPAIGASQAHPGLFYALGHQHLGLTLGPTTARVLADLIASDKRASFLDALDLDRFG
jgi:D-hydroxyproline dehydrogenase